MLHYEGNMLRIRIFFYTEIRIYFRLLCTYMPEGCSKQWCNKPIGDGCQQDVWLGGAMKHWHFCILCLSRCSDVRYGNTGFRKHSSFTPLTRLSNHIADTSLLAFIVSQVCEHFFRLLYYLHTSCQNDVKLSWIGSMVYVPHFGFSVANFLIICLMIIAALAIFQAMICVGVGIGKCLTCSQIRHMVIVFEI